jgi:SAM-dependent methyltransferase
MSASQNNDLSLDEIRSDEFKSLQVNAYNNDLARLHRRLEEFVVVPCPACDSDQAEFRFEKYRCQFVECRQCSSLFMSPRPTPAVMNDYYSNSENYEIWNQYIFPKSESSRREKICKPNLQRIIDECRERKLERPLLVEIGPGFGTFAALAKETGFFRDVVVVERTPSMAQACRARGVSVIESSLEDVADNDLARADLAVCFEVIEHVFEPLAFVSSIQRMLQPAGLFVFTCPNGKGFDTEMLQAASPAVDTEHVNLFNPESIRVLLGRAGFEVLSVETPGRLDVELVRRAVLGAEVDLGHSPFWKTLLVDRFDELGADFQKWLIDHQLTGNMRVIARKK